MAIDVINAVIFNDKEYSIIDMKYIRTLDEVNPFLLEHLWIQRGEILIGDYVRGIKAVWTFVENKLFLKELTYKKDAFIISDTNAYNKEISKDGTMETTSLMEYYEFTGRLRLARDAVRVPLFEEKKIPLLFRTVIDVTLHNDQIVGVIDRTHEVEEWRRALKKKGHERIVPLIDL